MIDHTLRNALIFSTAPHCIICLNLRMGHKVTALLPKDYYPHPSLDFAYY